MDFDMDTGSSKPLTPSAPSAPSIKASDSAAQAKSVKRPRPVKSCIECRRRKLKCDRLVPCYQCRKSPRFCRYADQENGHDSDASDSDSPEQLLKRPHVEVGAGHLRRSSNQTDPLEKLPVAAPGLEEISARLERLETLIGQRLPTHNHGIGTTASPQAICNRPAGGRVLFSGSGHSADVQALASLFGETKEVMEMSAQAVSLFDLVAALGNVQSDLQAEHQKALEPITVFVDSMMPIQKRMADILPPRALCDRLVNLYFAMPEGVYRMVHVPSFQDEYARFWDGQGCSDSFLPQLLCILCVAARFKTDSRGLGHDRSTTIHIPTACVLVRDWLDDARRKQVIDPATLQTELMLLLAQRTIGVPQHASWAQLGYVVRMALATGLQQDPSEIINLTEFNRECRRRLWFAIMEMDLHFSLVCNFPCVLPRGAYSCKPPRNLDDADLSPDPTAYLPESKPLSQNTDNQLPAYAARTLPLRLEAAALLTHLSTQNDYTAILALGTKLEQALDDIKYLFPPHHHHHPKFSLATSPSNPTHNLVQPNHPANHVNHNQNQKPNQNQNHKPIYNHLHLTTHLRLPLLALYQPFALDPEHPPSQLALNFLRSCMAVLTYLDELDPRVAGYEQIEGMYHYVLGDCLTGAALAVCFFIKRVREGKWELEDGGGGVVYPWSVAVMVDAVERALEGMVRVLGRWGSGGDVKGVVTLAIVLEAVGGGTVEERLAGVDKRLRRVWGVCLKRAGGLPATPTQPVHSIPNGRLRKPDATIYGNAEAANGYADKGPPLPPDTASFTWADLLHFWDRSAAHREVVRPGSC